jgi:hypothetical protein
MAEAWRTGCQSALDCGELALCQLRNRGREDQQDSEKPRHRLRKATRRRRPHFALGVAYLRERSVAFTMNGSSSQRLSRVLFVVHRARILVCTKSDHRWSVRPRGAPYRAPPAERTMNLAHQLFGGAIVAQLPDGWMDASDARPVPDNQEVWLEPDGAERSVVIEILERAECADAQSGEVHFHELANGNDALADSVLYSAQLPADALQPTLQATPAYVVHGIQHLPRDGRNGGRLLPAGTSAALHVSLVVLRLATQKTDILVSINRQLAAAVSMPAPSAPQSATGVNEEETRVDAELLEMVIGSLDVKDWGLFGE